MLFFFGEEEVISLSLTAYLSHVAKKDTKTPFLPDMRAVEWTGARGSLVFLSGFGPTPVSGSTDETG